MSDSLLRLNENFLSNRFQRVHTSEWLAVEAVLPRGSILGPLFSLFILMTYQTICGALHDLVAFVQFEKCEKHPWRSISFSKVAGF